MSGTSTGAASGADESPMVPGPPDVAPEAEVAPEGVQDAVPPDAPAPEVAPQVAASEVQDHAGDQDGEDHGFAVPTWYFLTCALPFAFAFLLPIYIIYIRQNSVPPMSATSAAWGGVLAGWVLWAIGLVGWLLGRVVLAGPRQNSPKTWEWWNRTTRSWVLVVLLWGVVATVSVLAVGLLNDRVAA